MKTLLAGVLAAVWVSVPVLADDEVTLAKEKLSEQIELIEQIEPYVERPSLARLFVLKSASKSVLTSIDETSYGHAKTFQEYQRLIVAYDFSIAFFREIETDITKESIVALLNNVQEIKTDKGLDASPYTQITESSYAQMRELIKQMRKLAISEGLQKKLGDVEPVIGEVIAISQAKKGDRRTVYPVARKAYDAIVKLYPEMERISSADAAYDISLEIQGLNEFYAEFAEFDEPDGEN